MEALLLMQMQTSSDAGKTPCSWQTTRRRCSPLHMSLASLGPVAVAVDVAELKGEPQATGQQ